MKLIFTRFMLFTARFEYALAILGNNRQRIAAAQQDTAYWEAELDRELLLRDIELY